MASLAPTIPYRDHLQPSSATPLERAFAATVNDRLSAIPMLLKTLKNPATCPVQFLDHLAFEVGVDIWNEEWGELKKRSVIAATIRTKAILGTAGAIKTYVELEDAKVLDILTPPQTPFTSKSVEGTQAWTDYLGKLPQLRVYFGNELGTVSPGQSFVGHSFTGQATITTDHGRDLLGRHAFLYDPKTDAETRITLEDLGDTPETRSEQIKVPGIAPKGALFVNGFVGQFVADKIEDGSKTVSYTIDKEADAGIDAGALAITLAQTFNPINARFDRIPVVGKANGAEIFVGCSFVGNGYVSSSDAIVDFYDRLYLADPSVKAPITNATSYVGHARLQMDAFTANVLVDAQETINQNLAVEGRSFVGSCFVAVQDDTKRNRILKAIELAKSGRDEVLVDFQVTEVLSLSHMPTLDGSYTLGQRIPRSKL